MSSLVFGINFYIIHFVSRILVGCFLSNSFSNFYCSTICRIFRLIGFYKFFYSLIIFSVWLCAEGLAGC